MTDHAILWEDIVIRYVLLAYVDSLELNRGLHNQSEQGRIAYFWRFCDLNVLSRPQKCQVARDDCYCLRGLWKTFRVVRRR